MKFSSATLALVATTVVIPALAAPIAESGETVNEAREVATTETQLEAREPLFFIPGLIKGAKAAAKGIRAGVQAKRERNRRKHRRDLEDVAERDIDGLESDIEAREPRRLNLLNRIRPSFGGSGIHRPHRPHGGSGGFRPNRIRGPRRPSARRHGRRDLDAADFEDVVERDVELDELDAREPRRGLANRLFGNFPRPPFFRPGGGGGRPPVHRPHGGKPIRRPRRNGRRSLESDVEEVVERDVAELDELEARRMLGFFRPKPLSVLRAPYLRNRRHGRRDLTDDFGEVVERDMELDELD